MTEDKFHIACSIISNYSLEIAPDQRLLNKAQIVSIENIILIVTEECDSQQKQLFLKLMLIQQQQPQTNQGYNIWQKLINFFTQNNPEISVASMESPSIEEDSATNLTQ